MSSIYLTGDVVEHASFADLAQPDWRSLATSRLQKYGIRVVNPIVGAWQSSDEEMERRVRRALELIDQCDALLANLHTASHQTPMEMFYAHRRGKMVTVVGNPPYSPWVLSHSAARFDDIEHALEFLIEESPQPDFLSWSFQYEGLLFERYEQLPPAGELDYLFLGGELPILTFAPHSTAYFRGGEFQEQDSFTGTMAAGLNRYSRTHALLSAFCSVADPLVHLDAPMVRAFAEIAKAGQIGLVLMILGSPWHENPGLTVESAGPDGSQHEDYARMLRLKLSAIEPVGICVSDEMIRPFVDFVSTTLSLPILVLRMHRRYRMPRLQSEPYTQVVGLLNEFASECGLELLRSRRK